MQRIDSGYSTVLQHDSAVSVYYGPLTNSTKPLKAMVDKEQLNYLFLMKPSIFKHLSKFLDMNKLEDFEDVRHRWCENGRNKSCGDCLECLSGEIAWECVKCDACNVRKEMDNCSVAHFTDQCYTDMLQFKSHIQHLYIISNRFQMDYNMTQFLKFNLVEDNNCLVSLHVNVGEKEDSNLSYFLESANNMVCLKHPPLSLIMYKLQIERGISTTLKAVIRAEVLRDLSQCCELLALHAEDPFCQHLVDLRFKRSLPKENKMCECNPELTDRPIMFFLAKLPVLQHLEISAFNLSTALLEMFTRRGLNRATPPLKTLSIFADYLHETSTSRDASPKISDETWLALVNTYPDLQLGYCLTPVFFAAGNILYCFPGYAGCKMLKVLQYCVPLVILTLKNFTPVEFNNMVHVCRRFSTTLQLVRLEDPYGQLDHFDFQELTSERFNMKKISINQDRTVHIL